MQTYRISSSPRSNPSHSPGGAECRSWSLPPCLGTGCRRYATSRTPHNREARHTSTTVTAVRSRRHWPLWLCQISNPLLSAALCRNLQTVPWTPRRSGRPFSSAWGTWGRPTRWAEDAVFHVIFNKKKSHTKMHSVVMWSANSNGQLLHWSRPLHGCWLLSPTSPPIGAKREETACKNVALDWTAGKSQESWNWVYLHRFHKLLQEETEHVQLRTPPPPPVNSKKPMSQQEQSEHHFSTCQHQPKDVSI